MNELDKPRRKSTDLHKTEHAGTRCAVIVPLLTGNAARKESLQTLRSDQSRIDEAIGLANALSDLDVVFVDHFPLRKIRPATLIGQGKLEEIKRSTKENKVELLIIDQAISPIQQRNLEKELQLKVLDRTGLILEIFGERAQTKEGSLQVELAHLNYQKSRLVRSWTHLERQRGGVGFLGGPGETQIESDRRMLQQKIKRLELALEDVKRTRNLHRQNRKRKPHPIIALVGYTNAGKSTLFNKITGANVMSEDVLFATLDPTLRTVALPHGETIILSDTVGFVSQLPHGLVAAFRATLEEVIEADLILHVRDIASPDSEAQSEDVKSILRSINVDPDDTDRVIEIWNKIDMLPADSKRLKSTSDDLSVNIEHFPVSAIKGTGISALIENIETRLSRS
ncbi:MAG: GTPase HflX, partial [Rhizobiales bacterium]|nr:GTPase HflX [Hyphomicrobiales bacterium]